LLILDNIKKPYHHKVSILSGVIAAFCLLLIAPVLGQPLKLEDEFLLKDKEFAVSQKDFETHKKWNRLINKLERRSAYDQEYFLEYLFYTSHQKMLKNYNKGTTINELLSGGDYDCVSGSIMYSVLLNYFNISHRIIETDYHVFIIAELEEKEYIYESTDAQAGFISDPQKVAQFKAEFLPMGQVNTLMSNEKVGELQYGNPNSRTIYKQISLRQLVALQYFNQGLIAINNQDLKLASQRLQQALNLYDSERINTVFNIIAH